MTNSEAAHILIVDDEPTNVDILVDIFEDIYDISIAVNGTQALEAAGNLCPDLILLDVMMPDMDGYEVCARLKREPSTADIPVVFITGFSEEQAKTQGRDAGAVDYIKKPINPATVLACVNKHIKSKPEPPATATD